MKNRRGFIQSTLAGAAGLVFSRYSGISDSPTQSVDSRVEILLDESILSHSDIHARNIFDNREALVPQNKLSVVRNGIVVHTFPAASVTALSIHLV